MLWGEVGEEMTDLIKRDDALAAIDTFKRDFEQSWKVQFSADIKALPAIDPADHIEQTEAKLAKAVESIKQSIKLWEKYDDTELKWDRDYKLDNAYDGFELLSKALAELEGK